MENQSAFNLSGKYIYQIIKRDNWLVSSISLNILTYTQQYYSATNIYCSLLQFCSKSFM